MSSVNQLLGRNRSRTSGSLDQPYRKQAPTRPRFTGEPEESQEEERSSSKHHLERGSATKSKLKKKPKAPVVSYDEPDPDADQRDQDEADDFDEDRRDVAVASPDEDEDDEYEEEPATNLPVVAGRKRISKLNTKGMRSIMGDSAEDIQQLLEAGENDSATTMMHRRMLQSLVDLLPYAEHNVRKSKGQRGVYQVNSLISSVRELILDLQSTQDRGQVGALLIERVIRPSYLDIGMAVVQEYATLLAEARALLEPDDYKTFKTMHGESRRRLAESIQSQFGKVKEEATTFMQR